MTNGSADSKVRVRFAPSPTGYLHVGGVRTLLFNWLFARREGGTLILRVDDTDQERSTRENEELLIETIRQVGIDYAEGPGTGGSHGPYRQSERRKTYAEYAQKLIDQDQAYFCFCSAELIAEKRAAALETGRSALYDGTCASLSKSESEKRRASGEKASLRFRALDQDIVVDDLIRGTVTFSKGTVGDFVICRTPNDSDLDAGGALAFGMPVYNFCSILDDSLMECTHVIRGEDHLSNTPKQVMILRALGMNEPQFAHLPMVLGKDKQKLSKRSGDVSTSEYLKKGYLSECLLNFLALLGWWPPQGFEPSSGHPEVLSIEEMTKVFSLSGLGKTPAVFDQDKLQWMNGFYIKKLTEEELHERATPFFKNTAIASVKKGFFAKPEIWQKQMLLALQEKVNLLSELPELAKLFFEEERDLPKDVHEILKTAESSTLVASLKKVLQSASEETPFSEIQTAVKKETGLKGKNLFMPMRAALTSSLKGPDLDRFFGLIGRESAIKRVEQVEQWQKQFAK